MNRKKWCAVFVAGCAAGLMVAICTSVWMERPGAAGGEVLILPLIGLLLYRTAPVAVDSQACLSFSTNRRYAGQPI